MNNTDTDSSIKLQLLRSVLKPLIGFAVKRAFSFQEYLQVSKELFIEAAAQEIRRNSKKVNVSRISVMTGIYRGEVDRIFRKKPVPKEQLACMLARVLGHWQTDKRFTTKSGTPRVLKYKGENNQFQQLTESVSANINAGTVLFELRRRGHIEETPRGLALVRTTFGFTEDPRPGFELLSQDLESIIAVVEENLLEEREIPNLHLRTEYDNIAKSALPEIALWLVNQGMDLHRRARNFISQFDKDINPEIEEFGGGVVVLGAFGRTEIPLEPAKEGEEGAGL